MVSEGNARTALVTGANRGLGLETCRQLLNRGMRVVMTGRES
jgi:(+)-neomenthol dehydrogenase